LKSICLYLLPCLLPLSASCLEPDPPIDCTLCKQWNTPHAPFKLHGNTWYVGTNLSSLLIVTDAGLILLDAGLSQSAPLIATNIAALGYSTRDIRFITTSHTHFDHAAGIAALQRESGAIVLASPEAESPLATGNYHAEDPQLAYSDTFPPTTNIRVVDDGETIALGNQAITVHLTPGHTPGGTSWTWQSCESGRCLDMVYTDSLTAVSAPGYRFTEHPEVVAQLRASIATIAALPCDIMVSTHPEASQLFEKLAQVEFEGSLEGFINRNGCREYAAEATKTLDARLDSEGRDQGGN
jgi:metallo-beta-lactamase class B